ncbi:MAG: DUF3823 domain-containing protein [Mucilaginibacter sp.]|nr:DUF3823 domain-containing protein [Mucilaginibacter sp.]
MKIKHYILLTFIVAAFGCKKDNYSAPTITLNGRLTYQGEAVNVEDNKVPFQLYQPGFGKTAPISGTFAQDGSYSTLLFAGNYKFTIQANQGPFRWKEVSAGKRDTVAINLTGNQTVDVEVQPFYMVRNAQLTYAGGNVNAVFNIEKVITDANARDIERVSLYINKTQYVSVADNTGATDLAGSSITSLNNIAMNVAVDASKLSPGQNYVFARVGIKIAGVEDMIFSPLVKLSL